MTWYVSRFANPTLKRGEVVPVAIALGLPKWPLGYEIKHQVVELAPLGWMLHGLPRERFEKEYRKRLDKVGVPEVERLLRAIERAEPGKDLALLCYEDVRCAEKWCHRSAFAEWWKDRTGHEIDELPDPTTPRGASAPAKDQEPDDPQGSLFR